MSFDLVFPTAAVNDFLRVSCVEFLVQICTSFAALLCFVKWVVSQVMVFRVIGTVSPAHGPLLFSKRA